LKLARGIVAVTLWLVWAHTAEAQVTRVPATPQSRPPQTPRGPAIAIRPFGMAAVEYFSAQRSFDAVFGSPAQPFVGGGLQVVLYRRFVIEATASWWQKTGERAFLLDDEVFPLGQPIVVNLVPLEFGAGYRFRTNRKWIPYATVGAGVYTYREDPNTSDEVFRQSAGYFGEVGVEWRVNRSLGLTFDAHGTYVPDILGNGGVSELANENDLGGISGRVRLIFGR
jgi:hypothetical protein